MSGAFKVGLALLLALSMLPIRSKAAMQFAMELSTSGYVQGLDGIDFSLWNQRFYKADLAPETPPESPYLYILHTYATSETLSVFYQKLLALSYPYKNPRDVEALAKAMFEAIHNLHRFPDEEIHRSKLLLLSTLAEETLFLLSKMAPTHPRQWHMNFTETFENRCLGMDGLEACHGDIILSEGNASSERFISRIVKTPGVYSHSKVAFILPKNEQLFFIESLVGSGTQMTFYNGSREHSAHTKAAVFRMRYREMAPGDLKQHIYRGIKRFIGKMINISPKSEPHRFSYDFLLDVKRHDRLFNSEAVQMIYRLGGIQEHLSPYTQNHWSDITRTNNKALYKLFQITTRSFPSPSDLIYHPGYDLISVHYDLAQLPVDRINLALSDSLIHFLAHDQSFMTRYLEAFSKIEGQEINQAQIKVLQSVLTPFQIQALREKQLINSEFKQTLFFNYLNQKISPAILNELLSSNINGSRLLAIPIDLNNLRRLIYFLLRPKLNRYIELIESLNSAKEPPTCKRPCALKTGGA